MKEMYKSTPAERGGVGVQQPSRPDPAAAAAAAAMYAYVLGFLES